MSLFLNTHRFLHVFTNDFTLKTKKNMFFSLNHLLNMRGFRTDFQDPPNTTCQSVARGLMYTQLRFFDLTPTGRALNRCLKVRTSRGNDVPDGGVQRLRLPFLFVR